MQLKKKRILFGFFSFLLFFFSFIAHYTDSIDLSIKNAQPFILLPLITAFSMFTTPGTAAVSGLALGICMDGCAGGTVCFNAIAIMLAATFVSVAANNLFNRNIKSAILLSVIISLFYYILRWLIFYAFSSGSHGSSPSFNSRRGIISTFSRRRIFSLMCPMVSSAIKKTGVLKRSAKLNALTVKSNIS